MFSFRSAAGAMPRAGMVSRIAILAALLVLTPLGGSAAERPEDPHAPIRAVPILLDRDDPGRTRVGALTFLAGWSLSSHNAQFGGLSSMVPDGRGGFIGISDEGSLIRFRVAGGRMVDTLIRYLPGAGRLIPKFRNDIESVTRDPATGLIWLGFEGRNMIRRLDPSLTRIEADRRPEEMRHWPSNLGAESMERLADGRFLVISEDAPRSDGAKQALLFPGDPTDPANPPIRFGYRPPLHFCATDARQLPDGRVLVLNRRATLLQGFGAALTVIDPKAIQPGEVVPAHEIARIERPLAIDNMEALSITAENGRLIVWIASDDNFAWFQRTLLMKFALDLPAH